MNYDWTINGRPFADTEPLTIRQGQRATLTFTNMSMMWHPMHLHGHTFQVIRPDGSLGARKDTAIVLAHAQTGRRSRRRQSRRLDAALPQHLPPRSRNDDQPELHHLIGRRGRPSWRICRSGFDRESESADREFGRQRGQVLTIADREIWRHLDGHKVVVPCRASLPTSVAKTAMRTLVTDDSSLTSES